MEEFNVCITLDTDADPVDKNHKNSLTFKNLDYSIYKISNNLKIIEDKLNIKIPVSWFVRIDNQVNDVFGEYDWILKKYHKFWDTEINKKNEIHWHAHIYEKIDNEWYFPRNDLIFLEKFNEIHHYLKKNNLNFNCIRLGEAFMTNKIMKLLKNSDLKADSSCIPGRKRIDKEKFFDWSNSPNKPYFPSYKNYQLEDKSEKKFIEIPMNTIKTKCSYDKFDFLRYANLAFRSEVIYEGLKEYIQKNNLLVSISHPYEFFNNFQNNNNLFANEIDIIQININNIMNICKELNKKVNFITIDDIIKKFINE